MIYQRGPSPFIYLHIVYEPERILFILYTVGIARQANHDTYAKQSESKCDRGHLLPFAIYSFDRDHARSTNTYTNAVPQARGFNRGSWSQREKVIRENVLPKCQKDYGTLYAITGVTLFAQHGIENINDESRCDYLNGIRIPRAMWTAVCCVNSGGINSMAFVGNNVQNKQQINIKDLSVRELQEFILKDMKNVNPAVEAIELFPKVPKCTEGTAKYN